jgi:RimJ/RimL family protein N-acetyltransferase
METPDAPIDLARFSPVRLATGGLVLREWREEDVPRMAELFDDPEIAHWTPLPSPFARTEAEERLGQSREPDRVQLAITTDGERPLGEVLLIATGELGYTVGAAYRGQGLAVRALVLLRDWAHEAVGFPVLLLRIEAANAASVAVAVRSGFQLSRPAYETVEGKGRSCTLDWWEHARDAG